MPSDAAAGFAVSGREHGLARGGRAGRGGHGLALRFAAKDALAAFPASSDIAFDSSRSFAVSFLLRTTQRGGFATLIMAKDRPGGQVSYSFCLGRAPGVLSFELWSWATTKLLSRVSVADGKWHAVTGAYDAQRGRAYLLVDGTIQAAADPGKGGPRRVLLRLGNNIDTPQPYRGDLDDLAIYSGLPARLAEPLETYESWNLLGDGEVARAQQAYLDRMAAPRFGRASTPRQWRAHAADVRRKVLRDLGLWPLPARLPLDVHVSGTIDHGAYTLERIYWQTWPHYYASGWLYLPKHASFPAPAILCPHGHWADGARNPVVQARCISLAMKGYVVLAVDSVHVYDWAAGLVPLTVMTWNNLRGLDLLCSMPQVDPKRLGCTGASGGAQQTFYLMALDDRIKVAVPVCMVCEFRRILWINWHHCPCNHVPGILCDTDMPELTACFAPRPSLIICATGDWTAHLPQEGYPQIKGVYELLGAHDRVVCTQYNWHHDYSLPMREEAYAFLNKYLMGIDDPAAAKEPKYTVETPEAMAKLDGPPPGALPPEPVAADVLKRTGFDASPPAKDTARRLDAIRKGFMALTHEAGVVDDGSVRAVGEPTAKAGCKVERLVIASEREVPVPAVVVSEAGSPAATARAGEADRSSSPAPAARRRLAVLVLDPDGKADLLTRRWDLVARLARHGMVVCAADVRPYGELALNRESQGLNGTTFGRPELAVAAHDAKCVCDYLRSRPDVDPGRVACIGLREAAAAAIAAGIYDRRLWRVAAIEVGDTYAARDRLPRCPRLLTVGDLPQLAAAFEPRPLWVEGVNQPKTWAWTAEAYASMGAAGKLRITDAPASDADLVAWLAAR